VGVEVGLPKKSEIQVYPISMERCLANTQSSKGSSGIGGMTIAIFQPSRVFGIVDTLKS